jgi:hypothetical protein
MIDDTGTQAIDLSKIRKVAIKPFLTIALIYPG